MDDVINAIPPILHAKSFWFEMAAVFALLGAVLNIGPLKAKLDSYHLDWLRPLVMLVGSGIGGAAAALLAGGTGTAIAVTAATAGLGSGYLQKFIQEATD